MSYSMQPKFSVGVLFSALSEILPLNRHAQALKSFAFNLNAYKVAQLEAYQQRIDDGNGIASVAAFNVVTFEVQLELLSLRALVDALRECVCCPSYRICRCHATSGTDCLVAFAQAFVWCGGIDILLPHVLRCDEPQAHLLCFQLIAILPNLQAQVDNALVAGSCVKLTADVIHVVRAALDELTLNIKESDGCLAADIAEIGTGTQLMSITAPASLQDFSTRATSLYGWDVDNSDGSGKFGPRIRRNSVGRGPDQAEIQIPTWKNIPTSFSEWFTFFVRHHTPLPDAVLQLCLFYLCHPLFATPIVSTSFVDITSMAGRWTLLLPLPLLAPPAFSLRYVAPNVGDGKYIVNSDVLLCLLKAMPHLRIDTVRGIMERLNVLVLDNERNVDVLLAIPHWQFRLVPLITQGALRLMPNVWEHAEEEKQLFRLYMNLNVTILYSAFASQSCAQFESTLVDIIRVIRHQYGWNRGSTVIVRLLLYSLVTRIISSFLQPMSLLQSVFSESWLNLLALVSVCETFVMFTALENRLHRRFSIERYGAETQLDSRLGFHLDPKSFCLDVPLVEKVVSLLHVVHGDGELASKLQTQLKTGRTNGTMDVELYQRSKRRAKCIVAALNAEVTLWNRIQALMLLTDRLARDSARSTPIPRSVEPQLERLNSACFKVVEASDIRNAHLSQLYAGRVDASSQAHSGSSSSTVTAETRAVLWLDGSITSPPSSDISSSDMDADTFVDISSVVTRARRCSAQSLGSVSNSDSEATLPVNAYLQQRLERRRQRRARVKAAHRAAAAVDAKVERRQIIFRRRSALSNYSSIASNASSRRGSRVSLTSSDMVSPSHSVAAFVAAARRDSAVANADNSSQSFWSKFGFGPSPTSVAADRFARCIDLQIALLQQPKAEAQDLRHPLRSAALLVARRIVRRQESVSEQPPEVNQSVASESASAYFASHLTDRDGTRARGRSRTDSNRLAPPASLPNSRGTYKQRSAHARTLTRDLLEALTAENILEFARSPRSVTRLQNVFDVPTIDAVPSAASAATSPVARPNWSSPRSGTHALAVHELRSHLSSARSRDSFVSPVTRRRMEESMHDQNNGALVLSTHSVQRDGRIQVQILSPSSSSVSVRIVSPNAFQISFNSSRQ